MVEKNTDPKGNIIHKESTTGFPKESNFYGDGVPILGYKKRDHLVFKVEQRTYSTKSAAVNDKIIYGTDLLKKLTVLNGKYSGLMKLISSEDFLLMAYNNIKSKPGNMTPGVDGRTLDGISPKFITELSKSLKDESFQFKPVKRTFIPKANGKMRSLGIPSPLDKIVQEAMRIVLSIIYEQKFSNLSHAFRPGRSCHSALKEISKWNNYNWVIEGDIKGYFDNINHRILSIILEKTIKDQQFIDLYWKLVRAGMVEKGISFDTKLGVPQGGIVSPILSNIYLHEFDIFMEQFIEKYSDKAKRITKINPEMTKYSKKLTQLNAIYQEKKDIEILKQIRSLRIERNKIPSNVLVGVRVAYVRYADD